ncbi:MAG: ATP-binding protein [Lentisphaeraceae bacterium]|nr:ATP-binding protein [Lentisphaeraceae bacterium]
MVLGDESSFKRIFLNLLSNAIKFTPSSGDISMSIVEQGEKALITISDSGIGIPKEMIPKLFDKYTEASRSGTDGEASTGLGMSIVKELIESNKGTITVESSEDEGTTFSLLFPCAELEVKAETSLVKETESIELDSEKISTAKVLIADDNFANLRLLEKILTKIGIAKITKANDGLELLVAFDQHVLSEPFDLVITDIEMPGKNGDDAAKLIRAQENVTQPYIIALSGHTQEFYTEGLFNKVLLKPVLKNDLLKTLSDFCDQ